MLRMQLRILRNLLRFLLAIAFLQSTTVAKCISLQLKLEGKIEGVTKNLRVVVEVTSATPGDSATDVRQETSIEDSHYRVLAWFNTTSNVVSEETCDRSPHLVVLKLMEGNQILEQHTLTVETDFRRTKKGDYEMKKPIILHGVQVAAPAA
jgi:hypothetical protein